ncbi:MAG: L-threonylcarbamoyladenylate synthase [Minisyncoccia bacterium]|jgi:L-threonylcarbamoyladenylate synthase
MKYDNFIKVLRSGGAGILPTDTIYGIVGSAMSPETVERIYFWRKRDPKKPPIILVASVGDLRKFGIVMDAAAKKVLMQLWPGKVSVILPMSRRCGMSKKFTHLHRGTETLAFRVPKPAWLRKLLQMTGPLIAPSANIEGKPPALTIRAAKKYFGENVDFYADAGRLASKPSTLIKIEHGHVTVLREGAVKIRSKFLIG